MKKKDMLNIVEKDTKNLSSRERDRLIKKLKNVKNISIKKSALLLVLPVVLSTTAATTTLKVMDRQPFIPDSYTADYYYDYYHYKDKVTISHDDVTKNLDEEYIIVKNPWQEVEGKEGEYCRDIVFFNTTFDITKEKAEQIIKDGYENISKYINEEVKRDPENTKDLDYVKETKDGEVAINYKEYKNTREEKRSVGDTVLSTIQVIGAASLGSLPFLFEIMKKNNYYALYKKSKNKLNELGCEPQKRKTFIRK